MQKTTSAQKPNTSPYGDWEPMMHGIENYVQHVNQELKQANDPAAADIPTDFRNWTKTDFAELAINRIGYRRFEQLVLIAKHAAKIVSDPKDIDAIQAYNVLNQLGPGFDKMPFKEYYNMISEINRETKDIRQHYAEIDQKKVGSPTSELSGLPKLPGVTHGDTTETAAFDHQKALQQLGLKLTEAPTTDESLNATLLAMNAVKVTGRSAA